MGCKRPREPAPILDEVTVAPVPPSGDAAVVAQPRPWYAAGHNGAVATGQRAATDAAMKILQDGGNAADAAAAAILALSVSHHEKFHFGGEVVLLVYDARTKSVEVIAGQGAAPRLATRERFARKPIPAEGLLAATVPGVPDALVTLLDRHGSKTWKNVVMPTMELLKKGKAPWHWKLERTLRKLSKAEEKAGGMRRRGLRMVSDAFYRGEVARDIAKWSEEKGGLLRLVDFSTHVTRVEEAAMVEYRGHKIWKPGAFTQGPALLETLLMLDNVSFKGIEPDAPRNLHLAIEAEKLAFADRDAFLGDPLFADVPLEALLYPYYASLRRKLIDLDHASLQIRIGDPREKKPLLEKAPQWSKLAPRGHDTTTCVVVDKDGNMVAATPSGWSGVEAGETGVWLGTRLQSFNTWPGHPNVLEPGKRPRITLTPTIVTTKEDEPEYAISVAGGDQQDQVTLQVLMNLIDFGMLPDEAVTAPRFETLHLIGSFQQKAPRLGVVVLDPALEKKRGAELRALGHKVEVASEPIGEPALLVVDRRRGIFVATGDPATKREAAAY